MKLDFNKVNRAVSWSRESTIVQTQKPSFEPGNWVKLLELPSPYSFEEALLLCSLSDDKWVAWIPDHGEVVLHARQFCEISQ
jgi:hypothetical protein